MSFRDRRHIRHTTQLSQDGQDGLDNLEERQAAGPAERMPGEDETRTANPGATTAPAGLERLLRHPDLWRAGRLDTDMETVPTGHDMLDRHLGGGWPRIGLTELLLPTAGVGELRLLLPLLRTLSREQARWVAWVDPPFLPYAPALEAAGVDVGKMLLIHSRDHAEALWALERASRSGNCSLALAWPDDRHLEPADTRRLQVAAHRGGTLTTLFRPAAATASASMAALRLRLQRTAAEDGLTVDILKRRGGWPVNGLHIPLEEIVRPADVQRWIERWRRRQQPPQPASRGDRDGPFPTRPEPSSPASSPAYRVH